MPKQPSREIHRFQQEKYVTRRYKGRLDPELWQAILRRDKELEQKPGISFKRDGKVWLDVIAKLKDRRQLPSLLWPGMAIESPDPTSRRAIVTGAVRDKDIEALRQDPNVLSLKSSRIVGRAGPTFAELSHAAIEEKLLIKKQKSHFFHQISYLYRISHFIVT